MSKATKIRKVLDKLFDDEKLEIKVVMPKAFLANLSKELATSNKQIADAVTKNDNKEYLKTLITDNSTLKLLLIDLEKAIKESRVDKVEVLKLPKQKEYPKYPTEIDVKKPTWFEKYSDKGIKEILKNGFQGLAKQLNLDKYTKKENALAVRLVDKKGQSFYDAMFQAISGGLSSPLDVQIKGYNFVTDKWQGLTGHVFNGEFALDVYNHDYLVHIPLGEVVGHASINKFGRATDVDLNIPTDIWDGADGATSTDVWIPPTAARIHEILSTDDADSDVGGAIAQGAGARTVKVQGLDANWDMQTETVIMDGTGGVETVGSYIRIFRMEVITAGAIAGNAGVITAVATVDVTVTAAIQIGNSQTLMAIYTVPDGVTAVMTKFYAGMLSGTPAGTTGQIRLLARDNMIAGSVFQLKHIAPLTNSMLEDHIFIPYKVFTERTDIKLHINDASKNDSDVTGGFDLILVNNS